MTIRSTCRIGVDIGGTFTDVVLLVNETTIYTKKTPSTPPDYSTGIVNGICEILDEACLQPADVQEIIHATTIATNTVLEAKGAKTALITTQGFRDVLEIGRLRRPELYNLDYEKPIPLVRRRDRLEIAERLKPDGSVHIPLDRQNITNVIAHIRDHKIKAVAVTFLHSYANPAHEQEVADVLRASLPKDVFISCSHEILPELREYERTSTTVVNAYVGPIVRTYIEALLKRLKAAGIQCALQVMQSSGGVMSARAATMKPACIIESGPAAGVIAAAQVAASAELPDILTIDMGGTTAKAAIVENGVPAMTTEFEVGAGINLSSRLVKGGGHAVKLPYIDVSEIGAGGGSLVRLDSAGRLRVGPDSAGSIPGPVAYDQGGEGVTLTDAMIALGYLNPAFIAGGRVRLNAAKARDAVQAQVGDLIGVSTEAAAWSSYRLAAATMVRAVKAVSTYRGRDPRDFTLFAFGGNGPLVAAALAELLEVRNIVIPPSPGVFSALGLLFSQTEHEVSQARAMILGAALGGDLSTYINQVEERCRAEMLTEGYEAADILTRVRLDLRYVGQAHDLTIDLGETNADPELVRAAFQAEHTRTYGYASADDIELVNIRIIGTLRQHRDRRYQPPGLSLSKTGLTSTREAFFGSTAGLVKTPVVVRSALCGTGQPGPLIVEEYDSTCIVPPKWHAATGPDGNLNLTWTGALT